MWRCWTAPRELISASKPLIARVATEVALMQAQIVDVLQKERSGCIRIGGIVCRIISARLVVEHGGRDDDWAINRRFSAGDNTRVL